jgi:hypothetical protein
MRVFQVHVVSAASLPKLHMVSAAMPPSKRNYVNVHRVIVGLSSVICRTQRPYLTRGGRDRRRSKEQPRQRDIGTGSQHNAGRYPPYG